MEYANVVTVQHDDQTLLYRYLENTLSKETEHLESLEQGSREAKSAEAKKNDFLKLLRTFQDTKQALLTYEKKMVKWAAETKLFLLTQSDLLKLKTEAIRSNLPAEDFNLSLEQIRARESFSHAELARWQNYFLRNEREDLAKRINPKVGDEAGTYKSGEINDLVEKIKTSSQDRYRHYFFPERKFTKLFSEEYRSGFTLPESEKAFNQANQALLEYLEEAPQYETRLSNWDPFVPYPLHRSVTGFLLAQIGFQTVQGRFGILPLFSGSLLVTIIALLLAIPFGVGSAIYVNQVASAREQSVIKPCIEFISAIPSVLIGFFGIAVLGGLVSVIADERLNSLTAGFLLALMTVPTIFTLAEDSLNNVP